MKKSLKCLGWLVLLAALSSCSAINPQVRTTNGDEASLIYGYFNMSESPYKLGPVMLTQGERAGIAYRQSAMKTFENGLFFMENIPAMDYHIPFFYSGNILHSFGGRKEDVIKIKPSSMLFVGSYKYHDPKKGGIITNKKFEMNPIKSPSEKEVLNMLLEHVKDERWKKRIKKRLGQLKGR